MAWRCGPLAARLCTLNSPVASNAGVYQNPKKPEFKRLLREVQDASTGQWVDEVAYSSNWYDKSHHDGKPWNLDRVNGRLDGNDQTRNEGRGVNIFVLDTGVDCEHDELRGRCENVGSYSNFFPGGYWRNKAGGSWGGAWETGDPFKKANDDFDGHGALAVYKPSSKHAIAETRASTPRGRGAGVSRVCVGSRRWRMGGTRRHRRDAKPRTPQTPPLLRETHSSPRTLHAAAERTQDHH